MKQLNFKNQVSGDDKDLIDLLGMSLKKDPSKEFVSNTLDKLSSLQAKPKSSFKPLKLPIFLMMVLVLFLLFPFLGLETNKLSIGSSFNEIIDLTDILSRSENQWYLISPVLVFLAIQLFIFLELRIGSHRNLIE